MPASPPSSAPRASAAVAPCTRDPRTRTDLPVDPRLQSTASHHQTAVVLPTQAKPSSTVTSQSDSTACAEQAAGSGTIENIFDRLLKDLNPVKSETVTAVTVANSRTCSDAPVEVKTDDSSAFAVESCASKDPHIVNQETDAVRKLSASPRPAAEKPGDICYDSKIKSEEMQLKASLYRASSRSPEPDRSETKQHLDMKDSDMVYDEPDGRLSWPADDNIGQDRQSQLRDGPKSGRRRASSQDREKPRDLSSHHLRGEARRLIEMRGKEKDTGPVAKKMRRDGQHDELKNIDSPESLPSDFT